MRPWLAILAAAVAATAGCMRADPPPSSGLRVTATVGMLGDAARIVAGPDADVTTLMGPGVDPHQYKARERDIRALAGADLVLYGGLHLEGRLAGVLEKLSRKRPTAATFEAVPEARRLRADEGAWDPHVWFDVGQWRLVVARVRDELIRAAPERAEQFRARAAAYDAELAELDAWIRRELAAVPVERRVLVTAHDAFGYFGRAYGVEVLALQGLNSADEAGVADVNALIGEIVRRGVQAVFVESSVSPRAVRALLEGCRARGHAVRVGGELYSDAMGAAGAPEGTYVGMVRHNVNAILAAWR